MEKLGYTEDEILATPFLDFVHSEDKVSTINEIEKLKTGKETVQFVNRYRRKDGSYIWLEWIATPDLDGNIYSIARDITQRKQAEVEILKTEEKYRSLFENMQEGVAHIRMIAIDSKPIDFEYLAVNPAFEQVTGLKDLVGRRINTVIPGYSQNNPDSIEKFASVANGGSPRQWEHYLASLNRWFQFSLYSPAPGEVVIVTSNITELKKQERQLHQMAFALNCVHEQVFLTDENSHFLYVNDEACKILGYTREQMLDGMGVHDINPNMTKERWEQHWQNIKINGSVIFETSQRASNGREFPVEVNANYLEYDEQHFGMGLVHDITERKKLEEALRKSEELLRQFIDHAPAALAMFDREMRYIAVSKRWINDYSLGDLEIIGRSHYEIFPEIQDDWKDVHRRGLAGEIIRANEDYFVRDDGTIHWLKWEVQPWHTTNGNVGGIIIYSESISELKRASLQLHELAAHLLNVREEEKTTIAREIHDELGGTLTSIRMASHSLKYSILENNDQKQLVDKIEEILKSTDYATGVTRQIVAGLYPTILDDLGILAALEWKAANFQKTTGIKCRVNNIQDNVDPSKILDKEHLIALFRIAQEALTNVTRHANASMVEIEFASSLDEVVLSIVDNGCGITNLETLGSGRFGILGMRERARQLGGRIILEKPPGGGLSLTAIFPLSLRKEK